MPGRMEIAFEFPLQAKGNKVLYETYHGVYVNIQVGYGFHIYTGGRESEKGQKIIFRTTVSCMVPDLSWSVCKYTGRIFFASLGGRKADNTTYPYVERWSCSEIKQVACLPIHVVNKYKFFVP